MTSKEIIDKWRKIILYYNPLNNADIEEEKKQITKDLERLEKLEKVINILSDLIYFEGYIVSDYEIKPQTYCVRTYYGEITQEEYELMKEVLQNVKY